MARALALLPVLAALAAAPAVAADTAKPATQPPSAAATPRCPGMKDGQHMASGQGMTHGSAGLGRPNMTPEQRQAMMDQHKGMMAGKGGAAAGPGNCPGMAKAPATPPAKDGK